MATRPATAPDTPPSREGLPLKIHSANDQETAAAAEELSAQAVVTQQAVDDLSPLLASRRYPAEVTRVSFGSTKTDNVVTYITWLDVDNSDLSLRPGMTAAATITSTERNDVLLVPNTALRFTPAQAGAEAAGKPASANRGIVSQLMPGPPRTSVTNVAGDLSKASATESGPRASGGPTFPTRLGSAVGSNVRGRSTEAGRTCMIW